jgi:hypothetical protein
MRYNILIINISNAFTLRIQFSHVDRAGQVEGTDLERDASIVIIIVTGQVEFGDCMIHQGNDFLRIFDKLVIKLVSVRISLQVATIQIDI